MLTPDPSFPFQQVAADYFVIKGHTYLVLVDRYSGWFTVSHFKTHQATSANLIKECIALFSAYGTPEVFSSDGGPQFTSNEFKSLLRNWDVYHRTSSPFYPQSNGRAEAAVKTAKRIISDYVTKNDPCNHKSIAQAILQHRNTPLVDLKLSPAQILFHRQLRDRIPTHPKHLRLHKKWILTAKQRESLFTTTKEASLKRYNAVSRTLGPLDIQTKVMILTNDKNPRWNISGTVVMCLPFRRYRIKLDGSGRVIDRNRRFLRPYSAGQDLGEDMFDTDTRPPIQSTSTSDTDQLIDVEDDETLVQVPRSRTSTRHRLIQKLLPHNKCGIQEENVSFDHRTTRSGNEY